MEEIEDEFYCGTEEIDSTVVITNTKTDELNEHEEYMIAKEQEKLNRISDLDFVDLWESTTNIFDFLEELQDRIGCVFIGTSMLRCINRRANYFRKHGVRIQTFTI
jgi:hypothetical protein